MSEFKSWLMESDGRIGYVLAGIAGVISDKLALNEGRRNVEKLQNREPVKAPGYLIDPTAYRKKYTLDPKYGLEVPDKKISCPITPLSGYKKHIEQIKSYAFSGPDELAFTMMFSPLSANTPFAKHWDNMQVLKLILKHYFPHKTDPASLKEVVSGFNEYLHSLAHTISGWKFDTVAQIWNDRESLFHEMQAMGKAGNDEALVARLSQIPGVQPVKAGFIVQLLFGRAGCIDTHNIDIYTKVFPDIKGDFDAKQWDADKEGGVKKYMGLLDKLEKRGIGSQQLWDVWVDFVEHFYLVTSDHGLGSYAHLGSSLDPSDPVYQALRNVKIPKTKIGVGKDAQNADIPLVSGKYGMGASATHLQLSPDEMLLQQHGMHKLGQRASDAARAVPFHVDAHGKPLEKAIGLGTEPSALHYFGKAIKPKGSGFEVDPDHVRHIVASMRAKEAKKRKNASLQGSLF